MVQGSSLDAEKLKEIQQKRIEKLRARGRNRSEIENAILRAADERSQKLENLMPQTSHLERSTLEFDKLVSAREKAKIQRVNQKSAEPKPSLLPDVLLDGFARKEGGGTFSKSWRNRYFVLRTKTELDAVDRYSSNATHLLMYYKSKQQANSGLMETGFVPITATVTSVKLLDKYRNKSDVIEISTEGNPRTFRLIPQENTDVWMSALKKFEVPPNQSSYRRETLSDVPLPASVRADADDDHLDSESVTGDVHLKPSAEPVQDPQTNATRKMPAHEERTSTAETKTSYVGVSTALLKHLLQQVRQYEKFVKYAYTGNGRRFKVKNFWRPQREDIEDLRTSELVEQYIKPVCNGKGPYCDLIKEQGDSMIGPATVYVCHSWKGMAVDTLTRLINFGEQHPGTYFYWDVVTIDQNNIAEDHGTTYVSGLADKIKSIGHTAVVLTTRDLEDFTSRAWCLLELCLSYEILDVNVSIVATSSIEDILIELVEKNQFACTESVLSFQSSDSRTSVAGDRDAIVSHILMSYNEEKDADSNMKLFDSFVKQKFWSSLLSELHKLAIDRLESCRIQGYGEQIAATNLCSGIGSLLDANSRLADALALHRQVLNVAESIEDDTSAQVDGCSENLDEKNFIIVQSRIKIASVLRQLGETTDSHQEMKSIISTLEAQLGSDHVQVATARGNLAALLADIGDYNGSLNEYQEALKVFKKSVGRDSVETSVFHTGIGLAMKSLKNYDGAVTELTKAMELTQTVRPLVPLDVARAHVQLAHVLRRLNLYDDALGHYQSAIMKLDSAGRGKTIEVADVFENIALCYSCTEPPRLQDAAAAFESSSAIREGRTPTQPKQVARNTMALGSRKKFQIRREGDLGSRIVEMDGHGWNTLGVSCEYLTEFRERLSSHTFKRGKASVDFAEATVQEICDQFIEMKSAPLQPYVMAEKGAFRKKQVRDATIFVSYTRTSKISELLDTLCTYGKQNSNTYFWLDFLMIDQSLGGFEQHFFKDVFRSSLTTIGHTLVVLTDVEAPRYSTRAWCLHELYFSLEDPDIRVSVEIDEAAQQRFRNKVKNATKSAAALDALVSREVDIRDAKCTRESDREHILNDLIELYSDLDLINLRVNQFLRAISVEQVRQLADVDRKFMKSAKDFFTDSAQQELLDATEFCTNATLVLASNDFATEAVSLESECIQTKFSFTSKCDLSVADSHYSLGVAMEAEGNYKGARTEYEEALRIRREKLPADHRDIITSMFNLATLSAAEGKIEKGIEEMKEVVSLRSTSLGETHPETIDALEQLGITTLKAGHVQDASIVMERLVVNSEEQYGSSHPKTAAACVHFAEVLRSADQDAKALDYIERAHEIYVKRYGPDHDESMKTDPAVWHVRSKEEREAWDRIDANLASIYQLQRQIETALND